MRRLWRSDGWSRRGELVVRAAVVTFIGIPVLSVVPAILLSFAFEAFDWERGGLLTDLAIILVLGTFSFTSSWAGLAALCPIMIALHSRGWAGAVPVILIAAPLGWLVRLVVTPVFGLADPYEVFDVLVFGGFGAFYAAVFWMIWAFLASRTS